jgi:ketosteroid isomerase-like protein
MKQTEMKSFILYLLIAMCSQQLNAQSMIPSNSKANKDDLAQLSKLNAQFIQNFIKQDTNGHNEIIHKDFVCIQSSGVIVGRDEYMKGWATGYADSKYTTFRYTEEFIRVFGDVALVRSKTPYAKEVNGEKIKGASVYTDTYVKENGRWWCVQAQITTIK